MPVYEFVEYTADTTSHIARITLNRPDRINALNDPMQLEISDALSRADSDDGVRVLVITGAGRAFFRRRRPQRSGRFGKWQRRGLDVWQRR